MLKDTEPEIPLTCERLPILRLGIQTRLISFPAQVPVFWQENRPETQWRMVVLYFVHGWSCERLGRRYGVTHGRVRQAIRKWVERAARLGYLQRIPPAAPGVAYNCDYLHVTGAAPIQTEYLQSGPPLELLSRSASEVTPQSEPRP